jgi:hypothetical protein
MAIESAAIAAMRRIGVARTMDAQLQALRLIEGLAGDQAGPAARPGVAVTLEVIRLAGLRAVQAAAVDDDMHGLQAELEAALDALVST